MYILLLKYVVLKAHNTLCYKFCSSIHRSDKINGQVFLKKKSALKSIHFFSLHMKEKSLLIVKHRKQKKCCYALPFKVQMNSKKV